VRTLKLASLLACCAFVANVVAQEEGRRVPPADQTGSGQVGATGQTTTETTTQDRTGRRAGMARGMVGDRDFAMMLSIGNQGEVEMANFVKDKLQNDQAKQFADQMIKDHTQFLQQLGQVSGRGNQPGQTPVGNVATEPGANPAGGIAPTPRTATPEGAAGQQPGGVSVAGGAAVGGQGRSFYAPGMNPMLSIKQEIAQECLNMAKKELGEKQGAEVDKCYIGTQIVKHADMLACLTVAQRHAQDSQFKELLGTGIQKTQQHLEMAKGIMKQLEQQKAGQ
jgi:predicted outer membrane protein